MSSDRDPPERRAERRLYHRPPWPAEILRASPGDIVEVDGAPWELSGYVTRPASADELAAYGQPLTLEVTLLEVWPVADETAGPPASAPVEPPDVNERA